MPESPRIVSVERVQQTGLAGRGDPADAQWSSDALLVAEGRSRWRRLARMLARRLLVLPVVLVAATALLVVGTTHRLGRLSGATGSAITPFAVNVYYREVELVTEDGVKLAGWHVPAWSADKLVAHGEEQLRQRHAGLVLCHGAWSNRSQWLHMVPLLHAAGYELLLIDLRGSGDSHGRTGLGLDEHKDVLAAVTWLQKLRMIDPQRIGVIASDLNAAAALRAAAANPAIRVVIADRPCRGVGPFVRQRFTSIGLPGQTFGRLYEWGYALSRWTDLSEASAPRWAGAIGPHQGLMVSARASDAHVPSDDPLAVLAAAKGPKTLGINPYPADYPGQSALLPKDLLKFLSTQLPVQQSPPPADQPVAERSG